MTFAPSRMQLALTLCTAAALAAACGGGDGDGQVPKPSSVSTALDLTFGVQGSLTLALGEQGGAMPHFQELPDGKLLLVVSRSGEPLPAASPAPGTVMRGGGAAPASVEVLRLLANGQPDPSFGQHGSIPIRLLGADSISRVSALPSGKVWLFIDSSEPCLNVDTPTGDPTTERRVCTVNAGTAQARPARMTHATAYIDAQGQLDASTVDLNRLTLTESNGFIGRVPRDTGAVQRLIGERLWFAGGQAYPQGNIYSWGLSRTQPDSVLGNTLESDDSFAWRSACFTSDSGQFDVDASGRVWTASSLTSTWGTTTRSICLEQAGSEGRPAWSRPLEVPLGEGQVVVDAVAVHGQVGHIAAHTSAGRETTVHTLQVSEGGTLVPDYGVQGVAHTALAGTLSQVRYDADGSAWLHSSRDGVNLLQRLNARGELDRELGTDGVLTLDGAAANSALRLVDQRGRWLMVVRDQGGQAMTLKRVLGNAQP
ncbi:hypothetical protein CCO03_06640 [Comamonas serinivorans]|uniref:Phytase-like domain-containing protein n=2 Tax=Comamonas serinivorans TaxID=1082851 RepID=A0A1Y0EL83_9BURK|nr:hypothetical protein CCO03_06640 [Comamonas serinivorans]